MAAEGFENDADHWIDRISHNFREELAKTTLETSENRWARASDVFDALDVIMNSRPDWATKRRSAME